MISKLTNNVRERVAYQIPSLPEIACAASWAYHKLHILGSQEDPEFRGWQWLANTNLHDVDVSSIPPDHLVAFMCCVSRYLSLDNVSGSGLVTILSNVHSLRLFIDNETLDVEETKALVKSMEAEGFYIKLMIGDVNLDIKTLTEYSGKGQCNDVRISGDTADRYRDELRTWAENKLWRIDSDTDGSFKMSRE